MPPKPSDKGEKKLIDDVAQYGWAVMKVLEEGDDHPQFAYSIGLWRTHGHPEILIIGLDNDLAHWVINEIGRRISEDRETFEPGIAYSGFVEGFDCQFVHVAERHYGNYMGFALWYYQSVSFPLLQCVYPDTSGVFPWDDDASEWFKGYQPILT